MEIILEEAKFIWEPKEIERFRRLWDRGMSVWEIAAEMRESPDNIALLVIDQAQKRHI